MQFITLLNEASGCCMHSSEFEELNMFVTELIKCTHKQIKRYPSIE